MAGDTAAIEREAAREIIETENSSLRAAQAGGVALGALALAACGGGGGSSSGGGGTGVTPTPSPTPVILKPESDSAAARFILQTSVAASDAEIAAVKSQGYEPWLDRQMTLRPVSGVAWLEARGYSRIDANNWYDRRNPGDYMIWNQLMSASGEPRIRAALALSEMMVVSLNGVNFRWRSQGIARYWDILADNAFGNFRDLLEEITLNPAMGVWLNTRGNRRADSNGRVPDENYAREVMQLFTIGLFELNPDGTPRPGSDGQPIETYTNEDVQELAKAFTGYDFDYTGNTRTPAVSNPSQLIDAVDYTQLPMTADPSKWRRPRSTGYHSEEAKSFLGTVIPAGTGAAETLRIALDTLFNHPNVGPFVARQMIQRLVTSNPAPGYVQRVAAVFDNNGRGERGDLGAMFKAIWMDDEALAEANRTSNSFGKVREPILRLAQWARTFGGQSVSGNWEVRETQSSSSRLGQSPLRSPSVFNFFRPGYVPSNSFTGNAGLVAPELQLLNESSAPGYVNFMARTVEGVEFATRDVQAGYTAEIAIAHDAQALLDRVDLLLTGGQLSDTSRSTILGAIDDGSVTEASDNDTKKRRVQTAVMLVMAAPEYLVQR